MEISGPNAANSEPGLGSLGTVYHKEESNIPGNSDEILSTASRDGAETELEPLATLDVGFLFLTQAAGELNVQARDKFQTEQGLQEALSFIDEFSNHPAAQDGFLAHFDLRQLRVPLMSMVLCIAEWGNEPARRAQWLQLNHTCEIVVDDGLNLTIATTIMSKFFQTCPPVCRTYLLTYPDQPKVNALYFDP